MGLSKFRLKKPKLTLLNDSESLNQILSVAQSFKTNFDSKRVK